MIILNLHIIGGYKIYKEKIEINSKQVALGKKMSTFWENQCSRNNTGVIQCQRFEINFWWFNSYTWTP